MARTKQTARKSPGTVDENGNDIPRKQVISKAARESMPNTLLPDRALATALSMEDAVAVDQALNRKKMTKTKQTFLRSSGNYIDPVTGQSIITKAAREAKAKMNTNPERQEKNKKTKTRRDLSLNYIFRDDSLTVARIESGKESCIARVDARKELFRHIQKGYDISTATFNGGGDLIDYERICRV